MSPREAFPLQIRMLQAAIIDNCERAACAGQTDAMALRLRGNALALGKLQLALLALSNAVAAEPRVARLPEPSPAEPASAEPAFGEPLSLARDRLLTGDALSRFVSRRLEPEESAHEVWQLLQEAEPKGRSAKPRRKPALPKTGFRSPPD